MASLQTATKKAKRAANQSAAHLDAARRSAVKGAHDVGSDLRDVAYDQADEARRYGKEKSQELYDTAQNAFEKGVGDIDKMVRNNPVTALGVALAIGFFLGARR